MAKIVLNLEPDHYSLQAIHYWEERGYKYLTPDFLSHDDRINVRILIVRLANYIDHIYLEPYPNLEFIITATTGLDHLDIGLINQRGIKLISLREHKEFLDTIPSTAEHTWALLMALVRNIPGANEHVKVGLWNRDIFRGTQLRGKTLGIIGLGRIGKKVADYGRAFQMDVIYTDPHVNISTFKRVDGINELFKQSDIVSIHVHLSDETRGMINAKVISNARPGLLIINTSRGGIWVEKDLIKAFKNGIVNGVATDVLDGELYRRNSNLLLKAQREGCNVIITPHIGGATWEAMWECEEFITKKYLEKYAIGN
jgi:D-3-phosphoglycerate dehydrogenase